VTPRKLAFLACAAALAALPGCGGAGEPAEEGPRLGARPTEPVRDDFAERGLSQRERSIQQARRTVEGVIDGLNRRDPRVCDAFTQRFLDAVTDASGHAALGACRTAVRGHRGPRQELVAFRRARFDGGAVILRVEVASRTDTRLRSVRLIPASAGEWRIDFRR
jgi:hypothetical protein